MTHTRPGILTVLTLALTTLAPTPLARAQATAADASAKSKPANMLIELQDVPTELRLPAPSKSNFFVTAVIRGTDVPEEVWLAREAGSEHRATIPSIGEGRYQLNLADDRVVLALRRTGGSGQCYVFARTAEGRIAQSAAVRFETQRPMVRYSVTGEPNRSSGLWHRADRVETISASLDPAMPGVRVTAAAGDQTWTFEPKEPDTVFTLKLTPAIVAAWEKAGGLRLATSNPAVIVPTESTLRVLPRKLDIPPAGLTLRIPGPADGPSEVPVPGANDFLYFRLTRVSSDGGTAQVTFHRRDQQQNDRDPPLGHIETFQLPDGQYLWTISAIQPAGRPQDAFVEVTILAGEAAEERIVRRLIDHTVRNTCCGDILRFNNNRYKNADAAEQISKLYEASGQRTITALLRTIEAREQEVGSEAKFYPNGEGQSGVPLSKWLRDTVRAMGWEPIGERPATPAARLRADETDLEPES